MSGSWVEASAEAAIRGKVCVQKLFVVLIVVPIVVDIVVVVNVVVLSCIGAVVPFIVV